MQDECDVIANVSIVAASDEQCSNCINRSVSCPQMSTHIILQKKQSKSSQTAKQRTYEKGSHANIWSNNCCDHVSNYLGGGYHGSGHVRCMSMQGRRECYRSMHSSFDCDVT